MWRKFLILALILLTSTVGFAQSAKLKGKVLDSSGLVMSGAQIKVSQNNKPVKEVTTSNVGEFEIPLNPGDYKIEVSAPDFDTYSATVKVTNNMAPLTVSLALSVVGTVVDVTENTAEVSVDADSSLSATTLSGDAISELPDDESELAAYLQQIAGTRGDANGGGSFVVDGFSNGSLPPKDQIQEIRVNNNPYSTEFSGIGFGRVEIITRAGTGNFNGNVQFNFKDYKMDAANPFSGQKPPYQVRNFNANYGGPLIKNKLTVNFRVSNNENDGSGVINATCLFAGCALTGPLSSAVLTPFSAAVLSPTVNRGFNARGQYAMTKNNVWNFNYNYGTNSRKNSGIGTFTLANRAADSSGHNYEVQIRETAIISPTLVHEMRFQVEHSTSNSLSRSLGVSVNVSDAFSGGGGNSNSSSDDTTYEVGNLILFNTPKWTVKAGLQLDTINNHSVNANNFNGSYSFSRLFPVTYDATGATVACTACSYYEALQGIPLTTGLQFTQTLGNTASGTLIDGRQKEFGAFFQNDWKLSPRFTFDLGARYESQTNLHDYNNVDPRLGFALGLTKTMLIRGGAGLFHSRESEGNLENLLLNDGTRQLSVVLSATPNVPLLYNPNGAPGTAAGTPGTIRVVSPNLVAPYSINTSTSLEKALPKGLSLVFSLDTIRGEHVLRSRNLNAPVLGVRPSPLVGNVWQLESSGLSKSKNFNIQFRESLPKVWGLSVFGGVGIGSSKNDTDGAFSSPSNNYNLAADWGRSANDIRDRFNSGISFRVPAKSGPQNGNFLVKSTGMIWDKAMGNVFAMINVNANSARPYNITTGLDDNGDSTFNDRPINDPRCPTAPCLRNSGIGPGSYNVNINFNKSVSLKRESSGKLPGPGVASPFAGSSSFAEAPQRGGGGGGFPGGGGPGGGGPGGGNGGVLGGGGQRGGQQGPPRGPTMTFTVAANNLLNNTQLRGFNGTLTSPNFGRATTAQNPRSINLGLRFNF